MLQVPVERGSTLCNLSGTGLHHTQCRITSHSSNLEPSVRAGLERAHKLLGDLRRARRRRLGHHARRRLSRWRRAPRSKARGHRGHRPLRMRRSGALGVLPPQPLQLCLANRGQLSTGHACADLKGLGNTQDALKSEAEGSMGRATYLLVAR